MRLRLGLLLTLALAGCPPGGLAEGRPPGPTDPSADRTMEGRVASARTSLDRRVAEGAGTGLSLEVVRIPAGRQLVTAAFPLDVHVQGAGRAETILVIPAALAGVVVGADRRLAVSDLTVVLENPQTDAFTVRGEVELTRVKVIGGKAAIRVEAGRARITELSVERVQAAVEVRGGRVTAHAVTSKGSRAAAVFVSGGHLTGSGFELADADYGLLTRPGGRVDLEDLTIRDARWSGIGLVGGGGRLRRVRVFGHSAHGAFLASDLDEVLILEDVELAGVRAVGLQLIRADASVVRLRIDGVALDGMDQQGVGVLAVESRLELRRADIVRTAGEGLAAQVSEVRLRDGDVRETGAPAVQAWNEARIRIERVHVESGPEVALSASDGGLILVARSTVIGGRGSAATADCSALSRILIDSATRVEGAVSGCVEQSD